MLGIPNIFSLRHPTPHHFYKIPHTTSRVRFLPLRQWRGDALTRIVTQVPSTGIAYPVPAGTARSLPEPGFFLLDPWKKILFTTSIFSAFIQSSKLRQQRSFPFTRERAYAGAGLLSVGIMARLCLLIADKVHDLVLPLTLCWGHSLAGPSHSG